MDMLGLDNPHTPRGEEASEREGICCPVVQPEVATGTPPASCLQVPVLPSFPEDDEDWSRMMLEDLR